MIAPTSPANAAQAAPAPDQDAWIPWHHTQPLILRGLPGAQVRYLFLRIRPGQAGPARAGLAGLARRARETSWRTGLSPRPCLQLGWTFAGLEALALPGAPVCAELLEDFARRAPAFAQGARRRAPRWLGDGGDSAPHRWEPAFRDTPHLVLSLHTEDRAGLDEATGDCLDLLGVSDPDAAWTLAEGGVEDAGRLPEDAGPELLIPLGLRDGITQPWIEGVPKSRRRPPAPGAQAHPVGDFLLGHRNREGTNPWALPPGPPGTGHGLYPDGSFGILRKMALHPPVWEAYLQQLAAVYEDLQPQDAAAALLGRRPDGRPLLGPGVAPGSEASTWDDFSYREDPQGQACPFGAHIRRMNPRGDPQLVDRQDRPLLRRGLPYERRDPGRSAVTDQGLMGLFFCADIETQFEHLLGQWGRHDALGSRNTGAAQDPFAPGDRDGRAFELPGWRLKAGQQAPPLPTLTTTRGTLYLWYPSLPALQRLAEPAPQPAPEAA